MNEGGKYILDYGVKFMEGKEILYLKVLFEVFLI